ncbi:retrovirus-related pol polyprotein from transposon TNT 1-94 [Tanacetum coccineum]
MSSSYYNYNQNDKVYHHQNHPTQNTQYSSTRSQQSTRNRGKAIVTSSAPTYDPEPATVTEDEEMSKEKEIDKLMALISLSFKKIYKPTNNNLRTSSNTSRANQDNSPRINRGTGYDNQRAFNVAGARENVGTPVMQKSRIQCYNCKEYGHVSRECQKPKRVKDAAYHKEKMLLCKQEEAEYSLNANKLIGRISKDKTPEVLIDFLKLVQRRLHAQLKTVRTDKGTEFLNKTHHAYFAQEGIGHQTLTARTPEQNGVVERRNRTLVEAARTMLSAAKVPLLFWAKAIATTCFTQNRSLVIPRHEKSPYHIINGRKPSVKFFYIFGSLCYIVRDGENLDKMKEKDHVSSDRVLQCLTTALEQDSLSPGPQSSRNVPQVVETTTTSNEQELAFLCCMFSELLKWNFSCCCQSLPLSTSIEHSNSNASNSNSKVPTVTAPLTNIIQAESNTELHIDDDEFIKHLQLHRVQEKGATSSCHVDSANYDTFYQHPSFRTSFGQKDHPIRTSSLERNLLQSVTNKTQLETDGEMTLCKNGLNLKLASGKNKRDEEILSFATKFVLWLRDMPQKEGIDFEEVICNTLLSWSCTDLFIGVCLTQFIYRVPIRTLKQTFSLWSSEGRSVRLNQQMELLTPYHPEKCFSFKNALYGLKQAPRAGLMKLSNFMVSKDSQKVLFDQLYSDHAGCLDSRKSTSGGIQFLGGDKLVSWSSKKQDCTSMSSAEAEYVSLSACCAQVLWLRTQLTDYGFHFDKYSCIVGLMSAIAISCNPVPAFLYQAPSMQISFIKEHVEKGLFGIYSCRN